MPTLGEVAEPLAGICVPVPSAAEDVCARCHGHPGAGWPLCYSCNQIESQVSSPCGLVVPVSLYEVPSQLHHNLLHYKDLRYPSWQRSLSLNVVAILCGFLAKHGDCINTAAEREWDIITTVPSTTGRQGEHPLAKALRLVPSTYEDYEDLLELGTEQITHNKASDQGFRPKRALGGERVLLVDDTFTSGARSQSAASALSIGGADVVAIVPVGRVINPSWQDTQSWWNARLSEPFSFDVCCLDDD